MTKAKGPLYDVHFRRRREGVTDYAKRLALLKSGKPRLVVRKTNKQVIVQVIEYSPDGDRVLASVASSALSKLAGFPGKCNTPSAYLAGAAAAKKALAKGIKQAVPDFGRHTASKGSLLYAALKGAADAGLQIAFSEAVLPSQDRIAGKHLKGVEEKFVEALKKIMGA